MCVGGGGGVSKREDDIGDLYQFNGSLIGADTDMLKQHPPAYRGCLSHYGIEASIRSLWMDVPFRSCWRTADYYNVNKNE